jgi:ABC-type spermidine/putrescine transport system permease subunit I
MIPISASLRKKYASALLLLPALLLLLVFFVYPLVEVLRTSIFDSEFTLVNFKRFAEAPIYSTVLYRTVYVSLVVTLLCFLAGYPAAYFLAHTRPAARVYLILLILLPFWMSLLIRTYSWIALLGRNGVINTMLVEMGLISEPLRMLYTTGAVYLAMVQILLPIMILTCYSAMIEIDQGLIKAARVLGASRWSAFLNVFFPLSASGAITGAIIVFILSMGFFVTPALVGGRRDLMAGNLIEFQVNQMVNLGFASTLGVILLATTVIIVMLFRALTRTKPLYGQV